MTATVQPRVSVFTRLASLVRRRASDLGEWGVTVLAELPLVRGQSVRVAAGPKRYRGEVATIESKLLWVTVREEPGTEHPPTHGDEVTVHAFRPMDARYELRGIVERLEKGLVNAVALRVVGSQRIQERQYVRVPLLLPPSQSTVVYEDGEEGEAKVGLLDISASGARLGASVRLKPGDEIRGELRLPESEEALPGRAVVVRTTDKPEGSAYASAVGATFVDLKPRMEEQIIRFVLRMQRELRQRGVLG